VVDGLVGRDLEVELARRIMRDLCAGQASTLLIEGEAGIGKTRVVQCIIDDACARGVVVFRGEAHPFERTHPFGAVAAALDLSRRSRDPRRAAIGRLIVAKSDSAATVPGDTPDLRYRVVEEILDLVETSCAQGPVLLVVEDLQWADSSTLLALRSMARELPHVPLLLVATLRPSPRSAELDQLLDELLAAGARPMQLEALSPDDVEALARADLAAPPGPDLTAVLAKASGNPLWVVEMLRSLSDEGMLRRDGEAIEVATSELPDSLRDLVVRRLRYLPVATLELLQVTAVLGDDVSIHDVAAVARRAPTDVVAQLTEAFDARLLGEHGDKVVFRHQLVHDAIYQDMPAPVRRVLHRDAAGALADAGADLLQVADHLILGAPRGDLQAVKWMRRAAREAAASAPSVSVELLRRAESLLPGGNRDADLLSAELVQALVRAGKVAEAAARAEAVLARRHRAEADMPLRFSLLAALSLQNRATELIEFAESTLEHAPHLPLSSQSLVLAQASYGRTFSGDVVGGEAAGKRALDVAERSGDVAMTVWSLTTLSVAVKWQGRYAEALEHTRRAVALASDPRNAQARLRHPRFFLGMVLCDSDLIDEARAAYSEALDEYDELGSVWPLADTLLAQAAASFITGEWDDALPGLAAGLRVAQEQGNQVLVAQAGAYQAVIAAARGDLRVAERWLAPFTTELESDAPPFGSEMIAYAAAVVAIANDDLKRAYEILLHVWRLDAQCDNRYYHRSVAPELVRLALALDQREVAREVVGVVEAGAALAPEVPTARSAALRCRGLVDNDVAPMIEAVELARRTPRLIEHAGACEDAARVLAANERPDEAKNLLTEALERYEDAGAQAWAARVGAALRELGVRRGTRGPRRRPAHGWQSLTTTERSVSHLVAEGLTNREVAKRLHISPHTVNSHLRHAFEKLSVSNRAALAAAVVHSIE
jgi:DNA-binding CsgD family transcriptional regulator